MLNSYQPELLNAVRQINSEVELNELRNLLAHYFAQKAQKVIDALWDKGDINEQTIEQWGAEHMRTTCKGGEKDVIEGREADIFLGWLSYRNADFGNKICFDTNICNAISDQ